MKEGSLFVLFCLYRWNPPNWDASDHVLGLWKALDEKGCMGFVWQINMCITMSMIFK
jgi:hypothetical protein